MCVHSAWLWNTMPVGRFSGGMRVTSSPSMAITPPLGVSKPPTMRSSVDLPEPDGPSRQTSSPSPTVRLNLSTATVVENTLLTSLMSRTATGCFSLPAEAAGKAARRDHAARKQQRDEARHPEQHGAHRAILDHRLVVDEADHQHRHGADLRSADQPGALGFVERV